MEMVVVRFIVVLVVLRATRGTSYIDDPDGEIASVQLSRSPRAAKYKVPSCKPNQYFDEEEGRCLGIPGGGRTIRVSTEESCGTNVLKPHCSRDDHYFVCRGDKTILARCPKGQRFEDRLKRCVHGSNNRHGHTVPLYREDLDRIRPPACRKPGKYPVPGRCDLFYTCTTNGHRMLQSVYGCPENMGYDVDKKGCDYVPGCENKRVKPSICMLDLTEEEDRERSRFELNEVGVGSTERSYTTPSLEWTTDVNFKVDEAENSEIERGRSGNESEVSGDDGRSPDIEGNYYDEASMSSSPEPEKLDSVMVENDMLSSEKESRDLDDYNTEYESTMVPTDRINCSESYIGLNNSCSDYLINDGSRNLDEIEPLEEPLESTMPLCAENSSITNHSCSDDLVENRSTELGDIEEPYTNSTELNEETPNTDISMEPVTCVDISSIRNNSCTDEMIENRSPNLDYIESIDSANKNENITDVSEQPYSSYSNASTEPTICVEDSSALNNPCFDNSVEDSLTHWEQEKSIDPYTYDDTNLTSATEAIEEPYTLRSTISTYYEKTDDEKVVTSIDTTDVALECSQTFSCSSSTSPSSIEEETTTDANFLSTIPLTLQSVTEDRNTRSDEAELADNYDVFDDSTGSTTEKMKLYSTTEWPLAAERFATDAGILSTTVSSETLSYSGFTESAHEIADESRFLDKNTDDTTTVSILDTPQTLSTFILEESYLNEDGRTTEKLDLTQTPSTPFLKESYPSKDEKTTIEWDFTQTPSTPLLDKSYTNVDEKRAVSPEEYSYTTQSNVPNSDYDLLTQSSEITSSLPTFTKVESTTSQPIKTQRESYSTEASTQDQSTISNSFEASYQTRIKGKNLSTTPLPNNTKSMTTNAVRRRLSPTRKSRPPKFDDGRRLKAPPQNESSGEEHPLDIHKSVYPVTSVVTKLSEKIERRVRNILNRIARRNSTLYAFL